MNVRSLKTVLKAYADALDIVDQQTAFVYSGCAPSTAAVLTVDVAVGVVMVNTSGARSAISAGSTTLSAADPTNPRYDIVYISTAGAIANAAGTAAASNPVPNAWPAGSCPIAVVFLAPGAITISGDSYIFDCRPFYKTPITAAGSIIQGGTAGFPQALAIGTANQLPQVNAGATALEYTSAPTISNFTNMGHDHGDADDGGALATSITLTTPTISGTGFTNANHAHEGVSSGGTLDEDALALTDVATNNSSTSKHGFLKKLSNVATEFMNGAGNWATVSGGTTLVITIAEWTGDQATASATFVNITSASITPNTSGTNKCDYMLNLNCLNDSGGSANGFRIDISAGTRIQEAGWSCPAANYESPIIVAREQVDQATGAKNVLGQFATNGGNLNSYNSLLSVGTHTAYLRHTEYR